MPATTLELTLHGSRSFEPPYDDELGAAHELTNGSLALALPLHTSHTPPPALRVLTGGRDDEPETVEEDDGPTLALPTSRAELPSPKAFGGRLVQALSEASAGERPLHQLSPFFSRPVYHRLERHFAATLRGTGAQAGPENKANVRSVHVCEPSDGVAEVAAVVRRGARMAAIALRLEGRNGRWQCTALQIG
jgi:hypothetical protein